MDQDPMSSQLANLNATAATTKPKPHFIALFVIICTLLIAGIVVALVTAAIRKNPDNIATAAVDHLLNLGEEPVTITGSATLTFSSEEVALAAETEETDDDTEDLYLEIEDTAEDSEDDISLEDFSAVTISEDAVATSPIAGARLDFTLRSRFLPTSLDAKLAIILADGGEISLSASAIAAADGKLFVSITDATSAIDAFLEAYGVTPAYLSHLEDFPYIATLYDFLDDLENTWWEFDAPGTYYCAATALNSLAKDSSSLRTAYANNPFITFSEAKGTYRVGINTAKAQGFLTAARGSEVISSFLACCNDLGVSTSDSSSESAPSLPTLFAEVDSNHYLTHLHGTSTTAIGELTLDLNFSYGDVKIETPEEYQPSVDLFNDVLETINY